MRYIFFQNNYRVLLFSLLIPFIFSDYVSSQSATEIKSELSKMGLTVDDAKKIAKDSGLLNNSTTSINKQNDSKSNASTDNLLDNISKKIESNETVNSISTELTTPEKETNLAEIEEGDNQTDETLNNQISQNVDQTSQYFGYNVFFNDPETFQNSFSEAIDPNYVIGPGDEVVIMLWGDTELNNSYTVSSEGYLFIDNIGQVFVNGLKMSRLEKKLKKLLKKVYSSLNPKSGPATTFFDASLGSSVLRPLRIFCVGEISKPGAYSIKNSSTVFSSLYYFNGPTIDGSLREIKLIRNEKEIANIDFYDFLLYGKKNNDIQVLTDDIIFIPPRRKTVIVQGEINRPLIYELKKGEGLLSLIDIAGGLSATTDINIVQVERILPYGDRKPNGNDRVLIDVNLDDLLESKDDFSLSDRDIITFFEIGETVGNSVTINGSVNRTGNYGYFEDMLLSDLIEKANGLTNDAYFDKVDIIRLNETGEEEFLDVNLYKAVNGDTINNINLFPGDVVQIYSSLEMKYSTDVIIAGHVLSPGTKPFRDGMTVYDLIFLGGGFENELHLKNAYLDRADLIRTSTKDFTKSLINFDLKDVLDGNGIANLKLTMGDEIKLYSLTDIYGEENQSITIRGEIKNPGVYPLYESYKLYDFIFLAGGFQDQQFEKNIFKERVDIIRLNENRIDKDIISINLNSILDDTSSANNIPIKNGDILTFYSQVDIFDIEPVEISGIVNDPGSYELKKNMTLKDLIFEAGGLSEKNNRFLVEISRVTQGDKLDSFSKVESFEIDNYFNVVGNSSSKNNKFIDNSNNIFLRPYDFISIRPNPFFSKQHKINVLGLVFYPGEYALQSPHEKVSDILKRAGGLRADAYPRASKFKRDGVEINLSFEQLIKNPRSRYNFTLVDGDTITIGSKTNTIFIEGSINSPGAYQFIRGSRIADYIDLAGGLTKQASKYSSYITYPDGKSKPIKFLSRSPRVLDGSTIYIGTEEELERFSATEYVTNLTSIWADLTQAYIMVMLLANNTSNASN